jgi:hypothetical protein
VNAHSLRSMFRRRHLAPLTVLFLLSLVVVCGLTAGTAQPSAQASIGNGGGSQLPPEFAQKTREDMEKDFNDDDLKVKGQEPRGKWAYGGGFELPVTDSS